MAASWIKAASHGHQVALMCEVCGVRAVANTRVDVNAFLMEHNSHYSEDGWVGVGDAVHRAASAVGVKPCKPCERRRRKMNSWFPRLWKR